MALERFPKSLRHGDNDVDIFVCRRCFLKTIMKCLIIQVIPSPHRQRMTSHISGGLVDSYASKTIYAEERTKECEKLMMMSKESVLMF